MTEYDTDWDVDLQRGDAALEEWTQASDRRMMEAAIYTKAKTLVGEYTGGRLKPSELNSAAGALIVRTSSNFGDTGRP